MGRRLNATATGRVIDSKARSRPSNVRDGGAAGICLTWMASVWSPRAARKSHRRPRGPSTSTRSVQPISSRRSPRAASTRRIDARCRSARALPSAGPWPRGRPARVRSTAASRTSTAPAELRRCSSSPLRTRCTSGRHDAGDRVAWSSKGSVGRLPTFGMLSPPPGRPRIASRNGGGTPLQNRQPLQTARPVVPAARARLLIAPAIKASRGPADPPRSPRGGGERTWCFEWERCSSPKVC